MKSLTRGWPYSKKREKNPLATDGIKVVTTGKQGGYLSEGWVMAIVGRLGK